MLTETECLAKAVEMDAKALQSMGLASHANYVRLAAGWRHVGAQAAWQDRHPHDQST
jgi:hypothetical protein